MIDFAYIKAPAAHMADWGFQTKDQAMRKGSEPLIRAQHVAIVAASHALAAITSEQPSMIRRIAYILINAGTHYLIDSYKISKWIDQALHLSVALLSAKLIARNR